MAADLRSAALQVVRVNDHAGDTADYDYIDQHGKAVAALREALAAEPSDPGLDAPTTGRVIPPFTDEHDRAEDHVADMLSAYLRTDEAVRAANDVMARLHLSGYDFVKRGRS